MLLKLVVFILIFALGVPLYAQNAKQAFDPKLISIHEGNVPILITVTHGGNQKLGAVPERTGEGKKQFHKLADSRTIELTESVMMHLNKQKLKPYVVMAHVHRKYVDLNRDEENGTEHVIAQAYHRAFHQAVSKTAKAMAKKYKHVFIIDMHGQARRKSELMRGTKNGQLVKPLTDVHGWDVMAGKQSIIGVLRSKGYKVTPEKRSGKELFSGGYLVRTHADTKKKISALQLEVGSNWRLKKEPREKLAKDLAEAITLFIKAYLS